MNRKMLPARFRQQGVSLVVTLVLVVLLSLLMLYGAGVLVLDTRSAANDYRARQALAAAEAGLEQGFSVLSINRGRINSAGMDTNGNSTMDVGEPTWQSCSGGDTSAPCVVIRAADRGNWSYLVITSDSATSSALITAPAQGSFALYLMTPASGDSNRLVYNIVARGLSADGSSSAIAKQGAYFYPLIVGNVDTPLASASNVPLSGNYSIITNPNGGGSGVPVSVWTKDTITVTGTGSYASCQPGDFDGNACPSSEALSKKNLYGPDLVQDPNFPDDLFEFLFGVPEADYQQIKDQATVLPNCDSLGSASSGLIWVTGDCNPPNAASLGTADQPILLVVEGDAIFNAGDNFYGMLYMFDPDGGTHELKSNGNATLHGAILAHDDVDLNLLGGFVLEYNAAVLSALSRNTTSRGLTRLPGSWSDVQVP